MIGSHRGYTRIKFIFSHLPEGIGVYPCSSVANRYSPYYKCAKLFFLRKFFKLHDCLFNTEDTEKSVFICVYLCESVSHVNLCVPAYRQAGSVLSVAT
jgi:hypothetical protein